MNDARVDHIEEKLTQLSATVNAISERMPTLVTHEELEAGFARAFEQTQGGFEDHRTFMELTVQNSVGALRKEMNRRFDGMDNRFDRLDNRFDRLERRFDRVEQLITGRPASGKPPRPRT